MCYYCIIIITIIIIGFGIYPYLPVLLNSFLMPVVNSSYHLYFLCH